jgi:sugar/nucleoside kinase (ribokinase family)
MKRRGGSGRRLQFLAIGHVTVDGAGNASRLGGAAAYASLTAARLGLASGVVTSVSVDFPFWGDLSEIEAHYDEARSTTAFENVYSTVDGERQQRLLGEASPLTAESLITVRERLEDDAAILYCPVARELRCPLAPLTPRGLSAAAPQGFFRRWDAAGFVVSADWPDAEQDLSLLDVVSMSEKDHEVPELLAEAFGGTAFAITKGVSGVRVYSHGDVYDIPAFPAEEVDPTGAGDVFAAAFLVALREGRPVPEAARFGCCAASFTVEGRGTTGIAHRSEVERRLRGAPR